MKRIGWLSISGAVVLASVLGVRADLGLLEGPGAFRPGLYQAKGNANNQWNLTVESSVIPVEVVPGPVMANVIGTEAGCATAAEAYVNPVTGTSYHWNKQNTTFGYFGEMYMEAGVTYVFGKYVDDAAQISIGDPATLVLNHTTWNTFGTGSYTASTTGWVPIKILIADGTGGKGPPNAAGINGTGLGMVYNRTGATAQNSPDWQTVMDPGDMSLFRAVVPDSVNPIQGSVQTASGYTLTLKGGESDVTAQVYYGATGTDVSTWAASAEVTIPANGTCSVAIPWTGAAAPSIVIRSEGTDALGAYSSQTEAFSLDSNKLIDVRAAVPSGSINRVQVRGNLFFCASQPSAQVTLTLSAGGTVVETRVQTVACGEDFLFDVSSLPFGTTLTYTVMVGDDASSAESGTIAIQRASTTLYWGGAPSGSWQIDHAGAEVGGWQDVNGNPQVFKEGDSIVLPDAPNNVCLNVNGHFSVGDFLVNATNKYTIRTQTRQVSNGQLNTSGLLTEAQSMIKRNSGTLRFELFTGSWTCDMLLEEGTFEGSFMTNAIKVVAGVRQALSPKVSFFGDLTVPRKIVIGTPTTQAKVYLQGENANNSDLNIADSQDYQMYLYTLARPDFAPVAEFVFDNGILDETSQFTVFGPLTLRNGASINKRNLSDNGRFFNGNITVERRKDNLPSEKSTIWESHMGTGHVFFNTASKQPLVFNVEEVTATAEANGSVPDDNVTDLLTSLLIGDSSDWRWPVKIGWIKRGPGKMELKKTVGVYDANTSSYTGDVIIEEGTVSCDASVDTRTQSLNNSAFGRMDDPTRKIVVMPGAKLELYSNSFANIDHPGPITPVIVSNATVVLRKGNTLPNLELYGSTTMDFLEQMDFHGFSTFGNRTYFCLDEPFVLTDIQTAYYRTFIRLCYGAETREEVITQEVDGVVTSVTNRYGCAEFCVEEAKNRTMGLADVILNTQYRDHNSGQYHCGLLKTGPGILKQTKPLLRQNGRIWNFNTGTSIIREGGYILDGEMWTNVVVEAGACLGGKGTQYSDIVIEKDGGFLVDATNVTAQLTVKRDLLLPEKVVMTVYNAEGASEGADPLVTGIPLPAVEGSVFVEETELSGYEALDTSAWRVNLKGYDEETSRGYRVRLEEDNTLTILLDHSGTLILFR